MTCFILFYHCPILDNRYSINDVDGALNAVVSNAFTCMGTLAMSYFFSVTGYLLFKGLDMHTYPQKIKRRFFSLFIPYVVWQCIFEIKLLILGEALPLKSFLLKTFAFQVWPLDGALWYVYAVFILALFSPILIILFSNRKLGWISVIAIVVFSSWSMDSVFFKPITTYGYIISILHYFPAYLVGSFYGKFSNDLQKTDSLMYIISMILIAFLFDSSIPEFLNRISFLMLPIMILYLLPEIPQLNDKRIYRLSFLIYAIHQPLIEDVRENLVQLVTRGVPVSIGNILIRVLVFPATVGLSLLIYKLLYKFTPKLLSVLTGGRS